jgi:hypothetical protein
MPQGLLEPLVPISNPEKVTADNPVAETPQMFRESLTEAARARVADVQNFQSLWRDPTLKPVWAHVESRIGESNGQLLQPSGKWEKDYDVLFEELSKKEKAKEEDQKREEEDAERAKAFSTEGEWQAVLERFVQRNVPGVRVIKGQDETSLAVALVRAGIVFQVRGVAGTDTPISEWEVSSKIAGRTPTKLEIAMLDCLGSRPRKWDLAFLLVCLMLHMVRRDALTSFPGYDLFLCGYQADAVCQVQPPDQQWRSTANSPQTSAISTIIY